MKKENQSGLKERNLLSFIMGDPDFRLTELMLSFFVYLLQLIATTTAVNFINILSAHFFCASLLHAGFFYLHLTKFQARLFLGITILLL
jgi:hypothetical protein